MRSWLFGDRPPLTEDERRLVLRAMAVVAIPLALIVLVTGVAGGALMYHELRQQTRDNRDASKLAQAAADSAATLALRVDEQRIRQQNALAWRVYDECVENENQDAANVTLYRDVRALIELSAPSPQRNRLINSLTDTIRAREPLGEKDCVPPPGERPPP